MKKTSTGRVSRSSPAQMDSSFTRAEDAYLKIMEAIQAGELKPGTRVREVELAEWLGSSRTPVREALSRLQSEGLLIQEPRRGLTITQMDNNMISELYFMREVLESTAAGLAARHASDVEISLLREIVDQSRTLEDDPIKLARNNRLFHDALYRAAHNRYLLKTLSLLHESLALVGQPNRPLAGRSQQTYEEHNAILSAIERRDFEQAQEAARIHIQSAHRVRIRAIFENLEESDPPNPRRT
jgi:DNA-binding GntR family transcriptional regulator